jgi:glycosyltransferase involved in cell wall biosynthesis
MTTPALSILIPARDEHYCDIDLLGETVKNVLANTSQQVELVVVLDGYSTHWPKQPLPVDPRITVIHHRTAIGQRAATNEAARVARGEYVMKLDAHCAISSSFDTELLREFQPDWTVVPRQFNLHVFDWKCKQCGERSYQSPKPPKCAKCGSRYHKQVLVWHPTDGTGKERGVSRGGWKNVRTDFWRFDSNLDFQYWSELGNRPESKGSIADTMSLLGACWAMRRGRYFQLEGLDESFGNWGDMGTEISCKSWLSGGQVVVNKNVWFSHFFRTGGIGFPWPGGGRKEVAKARGKEIWLNNKWPKQKYPLSWLIDRFSPLPDWDTPGNLIRASVNEKGALFHSQLASVSLVSDVRADLADPLTPNANGKRVTLDAVGLLPVNNGNGSRVSAGVLPVAGNELDMHGIATGRVTTNDMVQYGNASAQPARNRPDGPSVHNPVSGLAVLPELKMTIAPTTPAANPDPAVGCGVTDHAGKEPNKSLRVQVIDGQHVTHGPIIPRKPSVGYLYYTCNSHDITLETAARHNLLRCRNGNELGCVARERTDFGDWSIVVSREKSGTTMHYQILAGLERMRAEVVFLCESDLLYHQSHFDFTPSDPTVFYYNTNVWRIRWSDGHAVRTANLQQVSGICANRELLLAHYRKRIAFIEANGGVFDAKRMAYEPGTRGKFGDERVANWESEYPNLDITGHGNTLTVPHFSIDSFRNKKYAEGWQETDEALPGWPKIAGRVQEWLKEMADGG